RDHSDRHRTDRRSSRRMGINAADPLDRNPYHVLRPGRQVSRSRGVADPRIRAILSCADPGAAVATDLASVAAAEPCDDPLGDRVSLGAETPLPDGPA